MNKDDAIFELIALKARQFGSDLGQNKNLMKMLLGPKDLGIKADDLKKASEIFDNLEKVKQNSQMSKE